MFGDLSIKRLTLTPVNKDFGPRGKMSVSVVFLDAEF